MAIPVEVYHKPQPLRVLLTLLKLVLLISAGALILLVLLLVPFKLKGMYNYHFGFNQQHWQAASQLHGSQTGYLDNPRAIMVTDVMAHHLRPGMTRAQVLALLGPADGFGVEVSLPNFFTSGQKLPSAPEPDTWFRGHSQDEPLLEYEVSWGLADPVLLDIQFGGDNRVSEFRLTEH